MPTSIRSRLLSSVMSSALLVAGTSAIIGCSSDDSSDRYRSSRDYDDYYDARTASERQGDINTRRTDIADDGRLNNSARSYEERKADRAADRGDLDAARREAELRRERLNR